MKIEFSGDRSKLSKKELKEIEKIDAYFKKNMKKFVENLDQAVAVKRMEYMINKK